MTTDPAAEMRAPEAAKPDAQRARVDVLATLAIVLGLLGFMATRALVRRLGPHPSAEQCAAMLDRYAEQQARAAAPERAAPPPSAAPAQTAATDRLAVERCARELTAAEVACALGANNADELERCLP